MFVLHHVKKTFLLLGITMFASFLLIPSSLAKSGACSGHQGVNCSAGADSDGSVICMDGWEDSSVSYASMAMCSSYSPEPLPAPAPTPPPAREPEIFIETAAAPTPAPEYTPPIEEVTLSVEPQEEPTIVKTSTPVEPTSINTAAVETTDKAIEEKNENVETIPTPTLETTTGASSQEDSSGSPIPGVIVVGGVAWWAKKRFFKK